MWKNRLVASTGYIGVIETCMYPAKYYVGNFVWDWNKSEPFPSRNDTHMYHKTKEQATEAFYALLETERLSLSK